MCDLGGRATLVTGGTQGIGFGIACELARAGSRVIVASRDINRARAAAEEIRKFGTEVAEFFLDVTDDESVSTCVKTMIDRFSRIDVLVNNAGIHSEQIGVVSSAEHFKKCFDVNLIGVWRMTQAMVPHFRSQGGGKVVNIASINGRRPWSDTPAYSASKAALINLTQSLAISLGADNINVNAVCPGGVMTRMADSFMQSKPDLAEAMVRQRALKRALLPEDIGHAVVFLASPEAKNITGQCLNVDGGAVMS